MRRQLVTMVLAAAIVSILGGLLPRAIGQDAPPVPPVPPPPFVAQPAAAAVPVKRVVLYTSGVGYFEHYGTVHGDGSTVLSFKTDQINDVLKSLLLEDLDGGRVTGISYPTLAPLDHTLKSFQVDLSADPPLADILKQLRGAHVTFTTPSGQMSGQVLGVEEKSQKVGSGADAKVAEVWTVNLLDGAGIWPVDLDTVSELKLDDMELAEELQKALAAVAMSRDKDKKPVTISFSGHGDHRVRIGYVVETPIWKASYRIWLGEPGAGGGLRDKKGPMADVPADQQGKIQGWAIVDNQTDNDWTNVELSLVSGRPISFIEDLYQPLYVPRPTVQPDLYAGLVPQTYDAGVNQAPDFALNSTSNNTAQNPSGGNVGGVTNNLYSGDGMQKDADFSGQAGVQPLASGAKVGEAFQYTVPDVTLARQKSSMIPILSGPMQAQRLSIYNASVLPTKAAETTDSLYRFELPVPAGKSAALEVQQQHVYWQVMQILPSDIDPLILYTRSGAVPQAVKDALAKAISLKQAVAATEQQLAQVAQDRSDLTAEQDRMRKDMQAVSPGTDYYKKLLKKLDDQETQFEQMETHAKQLEQQRQDQEKQLEDYLSGLTVG